MNNSTMQSVSIVLPNLNHLHWLPERVQTILDQTIVDWECIVIDGESSDGSWEFFEELAAKDLRFKIHQFPPKGVYDAWNKGLEKCSGEFVYIATSDDTMEPNFLEEMLKAFQRNETCELATCCLTVIDENGNSTPNQWIDWPKVRYYGSLIHKEHVRPAPFDGLVHAGWSTVYTSITMLLIKKSLFDKIGVFRTDFGNIGDFEWGMRAGFAANVVHVPKFLATWRKYDGQATTGDNYFSSEAFYERLVTMSKAALTLLKEKRIKTLSEEEFNYNYYFALLILSLKKRKKISWEYFKKIVSVEKKNIFLILSIFLDSRKNGLKSKYFDPTKHLDKILNKQGLLGLKKQQ